MYFLKNYIQKLKRYGFRESTERLLRRVARILRSLRVSYFKVNLSDKKFLSVFNVNFSTIEELIDYFINREESQILGWSENKDKFRQLLTKEYSNEIKCSLDRADEICDGTVKFLGFDFAKGNSVDWNLDPWSQKHLPNVHWARMGFRVDGDSGERIGDLMFPNEPNKHQYFITLGKAYLVTNDEKYSNCFTRHLLDWIQKNPVEVGVAYLTTLNVAQRLISWVFAFQFFKDSAYFRENGLKDFIKFLYLQTVFLRQHLTTFWRPRNNYSFAESTALIFVATVFPEFQESQEWLATGISLLEEELEKQIWPDGVSFEQSSGYQRFVTDFVLLITLLVENGNTRLSVDVHRIFEKLLESLMNLVQPDGNIPLIGDVSTEKGFNFDDSNDFLFCKSYSSTGAVLLNRRDMKWIAGNFHEESAWLLGCTGYNKFESITAKPPTYTSKDFPAGGYYIMRNGWDENSHHLIVDCGYTGLGVDGHGGHGHNDILSFNLCVFGEPVIIDSGTYIYSGARYWRDLFRSTRAHNTVVVDDEEIADLGPGLFELRNQAQPFFYRWETTPDYDLFDGGHTGYQRLVSPIEHRRQILFVKPDFWIIRDLLLGEGEHTFDLYFHFVPLECISSHENHTVYAQTKRGMRLCLMSLTDEECSLTVEESWVSFCYGTKENAPVVRYSKKCNAPVEFLTLIYPLHKDEPLSIPNIRKTGLESWNRLSAVLKLA